MGPTSMVIQGKAGLSRYPERGILDIQISHQSRNKDECTANVVTSANHLQAEIDKFCPRLENGDISPEAPVAFYSIDSMHTTTAREEDDLGNLTNRKIHTANTTLEVRFRDFKKLGEVAVLLTTMQYVNLRGISWSLTDESQEVAGTEAKMEALRDALNKAKMYTEIIGLSTFRVVKLKDDDEYITHGRTKQTARRSNLTHSSNNLGIDFEPKRVFTTAFLVVEFEAE